MSLSSSAMSLEKSLPSAAVKAILDRLETLPEDGQTFDFRLRASDRDRHVVLALIHCGARARHEVGAVLAELDAEKARADAAEVRCLRAEERIASLVTQVEAAEAREREAENERDEARDWVRRLHHGNVLTCVYCGHAYPPGTPSANDEALRAHIAVCEKHPLRTAEAERDEARAALLLASPQGKPAPA